MVTSCRRVQGLGGTTEQAGAHRIQGETLTQQFALKLCIAHLLALPLAITDDPDMLFVFIFIGFLLV